MIYEINRPSAGRAINCLEPNLGLSYFPMQIIVLLDNQPYSILPVQKRYYFGIGIERKVLISKYSSSNFVMQI